MSGGDYPHTPGPWIGAGPSFGDAYPRYTTEIMTDTESDDIGLSICQLASRHFDLENEANAALIAAAPDLLAALIDVLPYAQAAIGLPRDRWQSDSVILRAEAAIAKATTILTPPRAEPEAPPTGFTVRKGPREANVHEVLDGIVYYGIYLDGIEWPAGLHQATLDEWDRLVRHALEHGAEVSQPKIKTEETAPFCGIDIPAFLRKHGHEETTA